jgi:hypothetical protein
MLANGIDLSCVGSATITSIAYLLLSRTASADLDDPSVVAADSVVRTESVQQ